MDARQDPVGGPPALDLAGLVRRLRRRADMSQRQMAEAAGVPRTRLVRAETGDGDLRVGELVRLAAVGRARLALLSETGGEVEAMASDAVRDAAGRLFPAHLDTRHGDEGWWGGEHRPQLRQPRYTFDLDRSSRDRRRHGRGTAADHHLPERGDSLAERREARLRAWARAAAEERDRRRRDGELPPRAPEPECTCPAGCDDLLAAGERPLHVPDCPCRCDVG